MKHWEFIELDGVDIDVSYEYQPEDNYYELDEVKIDSQNVFALLEDKLEKIKELLIAKLEHKHDND